MSISKSAKQQQVDNAFQNVYKIILEISARIDKYGTGLDPVIGKMILKLEDTILEFKNLSDQYQDSVATVNIDGKIAIIAAANHFIGDFVGEIRKNIYYTFPKLR